MLTRFGSFVIPVSSVDSDGWMKFKRLSDGEINEWHVSEMRAQTDEELDMLCGTHPIPTEEKAREIEIEFIKDLLDDCYEDNEQEVKQLNLRLQKLMKC